MCMYTSSDNYMYMYSSNAYNSGGFMWKKDNKQVFSLIKFGQKVTKPQKMTQPLPVKVLTI